MRRRNALAIGALLSLALSSCSGVGSFPRPQSLPDDLFQASRDSQAAPAGFHDGVDRVSCGDITLSQGEKLAATAAGCMNDAVGKANAELAVVAPTTEGDPIVTFYRTSPSTQGFEMYVNRAFDRYGSGKWSHLTCAGNDITSGCVEG